MAIFDAMFEFLDDTTIVTSTGTTQGTTYKTLDFIDSDLEMGVGGAIWLNIKMGSKAYAGTGNVEFKLVSDDTPDGQDSDSDVVLSTGQRNVAAAPFITTGEWIFRAPLPVDVDPERYLGILFESYGAAGVVGKVNAWLDHGPQSSFDTQVSASNI